MQTEFLERCPSCLSPDHREVGTDGLCGLRRCSRCTLLFVSPRPTQAETEQIYSQEYFQGSSKYGNPTGYQQNASGYLARAHLMVEWLRSKTQLQGGRWLDVGCGPGYLVEAASQAGFDAIGVDVSIDAVEAGIGRGLQLIHGTGEELLQLVKPGFQVLTMFDTLFHLREPRNVLTAAKSLLVPGGVLVAGPFDLDVGGNTPAVGPAQYDFQAMGVPEHLSFVNQRSMTVVLQELGFENLCFEPMVQSPGAVVQQHAGFLPSWLVALVRRLLRRLPWLQRWLHRVAARRVNRQAGYVLAWATNSV